MEEAQECPALTRHRTLIVPSMHGYETKPAVCKYIPYSCLLLDEHTHDGGGGERSSSSSFVTSTRREDLRPAEAYRSNILQSTKKKRIVLKDFSAFKSKQRILSGRH